jgi:TonB family protein
MRAYDSLRRRKFANIPALWIAVASCAVLSLGLEARCQAPAADQQSTQPAAPPAADSAPAPSPAQVPATAPAPAASATTSEPAASDAFTEDQLRQLLVGKSLYLRDGYLDNSLSFDEHGRLIGHSPQGSYTLNAIQIEKVHLGKHKAELEGQRYALHFLGASPNEDSDKAIDRVKITPKKKIVRISIDREQVVIPKKKKEKGSAKNHSADAPSKSPSAPASTQPQSAAAADDATANTPHAAESDLPADAARVTVTSSPAHSARLLRDAISRIFAPGIDDGMIASMPDFWKLYYQAVAAKTDYRPTDATILRQNTVDQKAKIVSTIEPPSNEYAQANGIAGLALYHAVIGPDGKPQQIVAGRPIGFGLDESAVDTIRKASFEPAMKDGKPVPVWLDLVVQFRIYSKRTMASAAPADAGHAQDSRLPGPYSLQPLPPTGQQ